MNWKLIKLGVAGMFGLSLVAMAAAAATADSDKGVRSDGSRVPPGSDDEVQGDPKGGAPPYDEGDDTRPDSTTQEAKQAANQGGVAEDTAANPDA
jgi:hypothetical protein